MGYGSPGQNGRSVMSPAVGAAIADTGHVYNLSLEVLLVTDPA